VIGAGGEGLWDGPERARRQAALGIHIPPGLVLEREEIEFCQRLLARYPDVAPIDVMRWLPLGDQGPVTGKRRPSYDFRWLTLDGRSYELKSPRSADYDAVKNRVKDDLAKGKTRFVVDLGLKSASPDLIRLLERYKAKRGIDVLIIMANNGSDLITTV